MDDTQQSSITRILTDELATARSRHASARERFDRVIQEVPSGVPHPDGTQRIHAAGREINAALEAYLYALKRFSDFVLYRIVPADLDLTKTPPD